MAKKYCYYALNDDPECTEECGRCWEISRLSAENKNLHEQVAALESKEVCAKPHDDHVIEGCPYCRLEDIMTLANEYIDSYEHLAYPPPERVSTVPEHQKVTENVNKCIGNDPSCPCQDGDMCHYEGPDPWPIPESSQNGNTLNDRGSDEYANPENCRHIGDKYTCGGMTFCKDCDVELL